MRVFKLSDGSSWVARLHDSTEDGSARMRIGWQAILFEQPEHVAQRLVYRPPGWLAGASAEELAVALEEGVAVRVRWGE
jgi:hypothetical protein